MIKYPYKTQSYNEERGNWIVFTHEAENVVKYHYSDEKVNDINEVMRRTDEVRGRGGFET